MLTSVGRDECGEVYRGAARRDRGGGGLLFFGACGDADHSSPSAKLRASWGEGGRGGDGAEWQDV